MNIQEKVLLDSSDAADLNFKLTGPQRVEIYVGLGDFVVGHFWEGFIGVVRPAGQVVDI